MKTYSKLTQWIVTGLLFTWGAVSFIILAGEEDPMNPMPLGKFFLLKIGAMLSLGLCCLTGKWLNGKGLIADIDEDDEI